MDLQQAKAAISKPQVNRLKDLGMGFKMGRVFGTRVLVQPIAPFTDADRVEKAGLLYIPETARDANMPLATTGFVLALGEELATRGGVYYWEGLRDGEFVSYKAAELDSYFNIVGLTRVSKGILQEGDAVMFSRYAGSVVNIDKVEYRMLDITDIMCTIEVENSEAYAPTTD